MDRKPACFHYGLLFIHYRQLKKRGKKMSDQFAVPTEDQLENLGAGCFVRISEANECAWVEIDGEEGGLLTGIVHPELASEDCQCSCAANQRVSFNRDQVKFVGCDRYCFC
jgi:hypothetical protein